MSLEYFKKKVDYLKSKAILPNIIKHLEDAGNITVLLLLNTQDITYTGRTFSLNFIFHYCAQRHHETASKNFHM